MALAQHEIDQWADPRWRLNNLYSIVDTDAKEVPFRLNSAQEALFDELWYLNVILKARQLGFTTFIDLFILDECIFNSNVHAGIIAHTLEDSKIIFRDKVKFPYDHLPDGIKAINRATQDSATALTFANNSSIRVGTSLRSGTYQYLHISEHGKICAKYPEKAKEIKTGSLNTVHSGQLIFIESTAEGQGGDFYDICERAQINARSAAPLTKMDFKFHFFPWWEEPSYVLDPEGVTLRTESQEYFAKLKAEHGIVLTAAQKAWYVKKAEQQGDDMKREFPSTPDEAFEAAVEGAYYANEFVKIDEESRIGSVPHDKSLPVETWWDLGLNDLMTIWFMQRAGAEIHAVDYYHNSGEGLAHYAGILRDKQQDRGFLYSDHLWPHDGSTRILDETGRKRTEVMTGLGYSPIVVERGLIQNGIEACRNTLGKCRFDEEHCDHGIRSLRNYKKEWNETLSTWRNQPQHNWACHGADGFRTGAMWTPMAHGGPIKYPNLGVV